MRPHEIHEAVPNAYPCKRFMFGDRWRFGIECEVQDCEFDPWGSREPYGSLWLWIDGQVIGNTNSAEWLFLAFDPFQSALTCVGQRAASAVPGATFLDKFDFLGWVYFGEDEDYSPERWGGGEIEHLRKFEHAPFAIFPRNGGPLHDGWEVALFEDEEHETLVWRQGYDENRETHEMSLPRGEVTRVLAEAVEWFRPLRDARVPKDTKVVTTRPVLVWRRSPIDGKNHLP